MQRFFIALCSIQNDMSYHLSTSFFHLLSRNSYLPQPLIHGNRRNENQPDEDGLHL